MADGWRGVSALRRRSSAQVSYVSALQLFEPESELSRHAQATSVVLFLIFIATRLLDVGTFASRMIPIHSTSSSNPLLANWKTFIYSSKYPPDISYWSLWVGVVMLLYAGFEALPVAWGEKTPFLEYGRAPFFFYVSDQSPSAAKASLTHPRCMSTDRPFRRPRLHHGAAAHALPSRGPRRPRSPVLVRVALGYDRALVRLSFVRSVQAAPTARFALAALLVCRPQQLAITFASIA